MTEMTPNNQTERHYVFNLETTKIELHFEKSEYDALTDEQKRQIKGAFLWSNRGKCWVSRAKEPNLWRAKDVAKSLGFTEEQREGERLTYAEQIEQRTERAEARADRYDGYAANAADRGKNLQKELDSFRGDISFFTQPNINSSAGRSFRNYREKLYARYHRGFEEYRKSDYFRDRAETARGTASTSEFSNPAYLDRRIKECKKTVRDREKNIIYYEEILFAIEAGEEKKWRGGEVVTVEKVTELIKRELELIEVAMDKQGYLENCLDECGGLRFNKDNIKVGYIVLIRRWGRVEIVGTGPVNVGFKILTGGAAGGLLNATYAEIDEVIEATEKTRKDDPHPFKVGDQFEVTKRTYTDDHSFKATVTKIMYEIIRASDTSVSLRPVGTTDKPIIRKPAKSYRGDTWRISIDDRHDNTFYKAAEVTT
jgi:hypothetical protein